MEEDYGHGGNLLINFFKLWKYQNSDFISDILIFFSESWFYSQNYEILSLKSELEKS